MFSTRLFYFRHKWLRETQHCSLQSYTAHPGRYGCWSQWTRCKYKYLNPQDNGSFWSLLSSIFLSNYIWAVAWDFQQCGICDQQSFRSACAYAQSDQSLCESLEYSMKIKLLTAQHLEFLSLKGGCTGSSEFALVKMPYCLKSRLIL